MTDPEIVRSVLHKSRENLLWSLAAAVELVDPIRVLMLRQTLKEVLTVLQPPSSEWDECAIASTRAAMDYLKQRYQANVDRDDRIIPH